MIRAAGQGVARTIDAFLPIIWNQRRRAVSDYGELWREFYTLIRELHGTSVIVDGSKRSRRVALMSRALRDTATVNVIHLVRDPRGFVASARRLNNDVDLRATAWIWADLHRRMAALGSRLPYLRVRYEDLALRPAETIAGVFDFLGVSGQPVIAPPKFPEKHHMVGNAMLFRFNGQVRLEERWRDELTQAEQIQILGQAGGIADTYGYA